MSAENNAAAKDAADDVLAKIAGVVEEAVDRKFAQMTPGAQSHERNIGAPNLNLKTSLGNDFATSFHDYVRSGNMKMIPEEFLDPETKGWYFKASNATDMNITTSADGGYLVPTGFVADVFKKAQEMSLIEELGLTRVFGVGTTVNYPVETAIPNPFIATSESAQYDLDAQAFGTKPFTLAKYTKKARITEELLADTPVALLEYVRSYFARAAALTYNQLIITEALTNGTVLATTSSATVATAAEIKQLPYKLPEGYSAARWVMKTATEGSIRALTVSNTFAFDGVQVAPLLEGLPVSHSDYVEAYGTTAKKFALLGDFSKMGYRIGDGMVIKVDPYSRQDYGETVLNAAIRASFKILDASGIGYIKHA